MVRSKGGKPGLFVLILLICIFYDWATGCAGILLLMTKADRAVTAFYMASTEQRFLAAGLATIMVISPFIVGKFMYKVKEDPGMIGRFFKGLFGA